MEITPQIQMRRDLLRMTSAEVQAFIERQARENPALEKVVPETGVRIMQEESPAGAPAPDVFVEEVDGEYGIYFPDDDGPSWRVSQNYVQALARPEAAAEEREAIKSNVRSAIDLLRNLAHRRLSIYLVVEYIVRSQPDVWGRWPSPIKPVSPGEVARGTGMSESAVSLTVAGKYLQTRHGVVELRRIFTEG
jgi:RNA polymerase sigma-54 factor